MKTTNWKEFWNTSKEYRLEKINSFNLVNNHLTQPPRNILDIGCGFAFESRLFYKKYQSKIWLIDGDVQSQKNKKVREIKFGAVDTMGFYNKLEDIEQVLIQDNIADYQLIDVNNLTIPETEKFDLICSYFSCGFHYPISSYIDIIKKHSHENTTLIFDIRTKNLEDNPVEIVKILEEGEKHIKAVIKL